MRALRRFAILGSILLATGCGMAVFTEGARERYGLSRDDIRRVQFYTSDEIVLRREVNEQDKARSGNRLAIRDGVVVDEVVIPKHTPCVVLRDAGDFLLLGFTPGHPEQSLWFGTKNDDPSVPPEARRFELVALDNLADDPEPFTPRWAKGFLVTYAGKKYQVAGARSWNAHLLYDIDATYARETVQEKPSGWKLNEAPPPPAPPPPPPSVDAGTND